MQITRGAKNDTTNPAGSPKIIDMTPRGEEVPTPFERFEDFVKKMAQVSKEELDEKRAEYEQEKKRNKRAR